MTIDKHSGEEARALIRLHASVLFQWAQQHPAVISPALKEALMATAARLYEVVEALPVIVPKEHPIDMRQTIKGKVQH